MIPFTCGVLFMSEVVQYDVIMLWLFDLFSILRLYIKVYYPDPL